MRRTTFFEGLKLWSRRKHRLIGKYLPPFIAKVSSHAAKVYCVDAFAGKAKYEDGSPGSPLMMANFADKCAAWRRPVDLRLINVEADPQNFESLRYVTEQWEKRGVVRNIHGEFGDVVSEVLSEIGAAPALFFIDPYGPTAIHFSYLQPILNRAQQKTELIINFDHDGLRRLTDQLRSKAKSSSSIKGAQTTVARAAKIVGSDRWKTVFETQDLTSEEREQVLLKEYMENLARCNYTAAAYPIREFIDTPIKYYLVFCTRHPDGIRLMNDFICEEEEAILQDSTTDPLQHQLFDEVQQARIRRHEELKRLTFDYVQNVKRTTRGSIKQHFIYQYHGVYHDKEYNAVVRELLDEGLLQAGRRRINDSDLLTYAPKQEGLLI